jgi:glucosylglycerate synthase
MSTLPSLDVQNIDEAQGPTPARSTQPSFAVCLPSMAADDLAGMVRKLRELFAGDPLLFASPEQAEPEQIGEDGTRIVPYPVQRTASEWVLNPADYAAAARLVAEGNAAGVLLLGTEAASLSAATMLGLRQLLTANVDMVVPRYRTGPEEGLVNSALLYPLTRALFGLDIRFPLPLDAALSPRMLNRLASVANRAGNQGDGLVWPVAEAAIAGFSVRQTELGERILPRPQEADLNVLFPAVTSSMFADIESKATFWQRARTVPAARPFTPATAPLNPEGAEEIRSLVEGFRLAFSNLREIWSLVLPPQTLLALKKLSLTAPESFSFQPSLWARVVYDFALAFHLRTLNRGHLLGALTPLYLAWVASLLREGNGTAGSAALLESTASAFEQEKPYLVSRWRWPDRFNP